MNALEQRDKAVVVAARAHEGQLRKDGSPYFSHPVCVVFQLGRLQGGSPDIVLQTIALLHDVVEDTTITMEDLRTYGFSEVVLQAVDALTKRPGEKYMDFIDRCAANEQARWVKIADIRDNLSDQSALDPEEAAFLTERYTKALKRLES